MTKPLRAAHGHELFAAIRAALTSGGDAVFVGEPVGTIPAEVPSRVAIVVQSSGSTGRPKRVALSTDAVLASAAASESALGGPGQWLLALPTTYIAGVNVLVRSICAQTKPEAVPAGPFTVDGFVQAAARLDQRLRFTSLVPAQLAMLMQSDAAWPALRRFDRILLGGQSAPAALLEQADELGLIVVRSYGSSETCGGCVYDGEPIGSAELRIVDGQVEIAGPMLADGYLGDDERTAAAFYVDGGTRWYRSGDAGVIADGVLSVTGRLDDVIISGGMKVSLAELESMLQELPGLADAVVVKMRSERWGEAPVLVTTVAVTVDELKELIVARLGRAAVPERIVRVERIPLLASGKPDRQAVLRALDR